MSDKILASSASNVSDLWEITSSLITGNKRGLDVAVGGSVLTESSGVQWDLITITYPSAISEVFTYTLLGVTKRIITITYTDSSKSDISTVARV